MSSECKRLEKLYERAGNTRCDHGHGEERGFPAHDGEELARCKDKASSGRVPECGIFTNKISRLSVHDDYVLPCLTCPVKGLFIAVPQIEPQLSDTARHSRKTQ